MRKLLFSNHCAELVFTIFVVLFSFQFSFGQSKVEQIDELLSMLSKQSQFSGSVLIADKGKILLEKGYGIANEEFGQTLNENSIYELASVSKQFTAMGVVILKEKGKLSFDDKLTKFIPELKQYDNVSIRNLLNHTSGIPDYLSQIQPTLFDKSKINTNKDIIDLLAKNKLPLLFAPGAKFEYSNTGYALLASVIERAAGQSYAAFLEKSVFKPLKMKNTFVYSRRLRPRKIDNYAFGYVYSSDTKRNVLPDSIDPQSFVIYLDGVVGDGGVNSTVIDLFKWDRALTQSKLVTKQSLSEVFSPAVLADGIETDYGFGWFVENDKNYGKIVQHSGSVPGYKTYIERHLDADKTIIILQNNENVVLPKKNIREILYNQPVSKMYYKQTVLSSESANKFTGEYQSTSEKENIISITKGDDWLIYNATKQKWGLKFYPASETFYFVKEPMFNIQIEFAQAGNQTLIKLYQNGKLIEEGTKITQ